MCDVSDPKIAQAYAEIEQSEDTNWYERYKNKFISAALLKKKGEIISFFFYCHDNNIIKVDSRLQ